MAKLVGANPDANVQTIVQMTKLGLPVTGGDGGSSLKIICPTGRHSWERWIWQRDI